MRRVFVVLTLALAGAGVAASPVSAASCAAKAGRTEIDNREVRVFSRVFDRPDRRYFACWRASGRTVRFSEDDLRSEVGGIVLRGRYLKWEDDRSDSYGDGFLTVSVMDVSKGRVNASKTFRSQFPSSTSIPDLRIWGERLKVNGSYAFLVGPFDGDWPDHTYGVVRFVRTTRTELARGPDIDPRSFRASRTLIRWARGDLPESAPFE